MNRETPEKKAIRLKLTKEGMQDYVDKECKSLKIFIKGHGGMRMLEYLTEKEKDVVLKRIRDKMSEPDIAKEMGISQQRVNEIVKTSKEKIKRQKEVEEYIY